MLEKYPFIVEDLAANFEAAERKKAEQERNEKPTNTNQSNSPPNPTKDTSNSSNLENKAEITQLQNEKLQLEVKAEELRELIKKVDLSQEKIKDLENQLTQILKEIQGKNAKIHQIKTREKAPSQTTQPTTTNPAS